MVDLLSKLYQHETKQVPNKFQTLLILLIGIDMKKKLLFVYCFLFTIEMCAQIMPYRNPDLCPEDRAKDLISRLTLEEKAVLMCDVSEAIPRLGIKKFNWWSEALHGLANNDSVTVFPEPIGMAASFDDKLVYNIFNAVSDEVRAKYNESKKNGNENRRFLSLSVWTPNINIFRDPRWGRGQETYGEDPYLTSRMGISVVEGLQGPSDSKYKKLLSCAKHFAVHSGPEWSRHSINLNNIDSRDLWETYLPAFKSLVMDADVREVMCAYQRLDDEPCCGNSRLLRNILRDDWGFKYLIVSDCGAITDFYQSHKISSDAVHAAAKGVLAGTDVECGFNYAFRELPEAVKKGLVSEDEINKHLMRVLIGRFDLGEMDDDSLVEWSKIPISTVNSKEHQKLALEIACESMTLLQNKNNILPLTEHDKKIAIIGPNADDKPLMWGSYNGTPFNTITILDGIKSKLPADKIVYDKGCDIVENTVTESAFGECSIQGKPGFKATYWNNREFKGDIAATEQIINPIKLTTFGQHEFSTGVHLQNFSAKYETIYRPSQSGELVFKLEACGAFELIVNGDTLSKVFMWRPLPKQVPLKVEKGKEYKIEACFRQVENWTASLGMNFGKEVPVKYDALIEKLKGIDVVIFAGGISSQLEGEEMPIQLPGFKQGDRTDIELPAVQRNCLKALKQAGKKVIFINCSGSAMGLVPETESCGAILQAWYAGESGGQAIADVLFGDFNPSGKLPITFYKNIQQLPDFEDYSMKGRTYRYMSDPLFPFGYGLSYTTFSIGSAKTNKTEIKVNDGIDLKIPVSNTGKRDGIEVVQVYMRKLNDAGGPLKSLRAFKRVEVKAGETQNVTLELPSKTFECFDPANNTMNVSAGEYELLYGNSSDNKDLKSIKVTIE
jgi:beta-glucosidase